MTCFFCDKTASIIKFLVCPVHMMPRTNSYEVCDNHIKENLTFDKVFNHDGTRKQFKSKIQGE